MKNIFVFIIFISKFRLLFIKLFQTFNLNTETNFLNQKISVFCLWFVCFYFFNFFYLNFFLIFFFFCSDGLMVYRGSNVVLDHISVSWSTDENIGCNDAQNITFSNSITSEALYDSNHEDDPSGNPGVVVPHSMGALFSLPSQLSIHHTMFARNVGRNPQVSA